MTDLARAWAELPQITNVHASGDGRWAFWCWAGPTGTEDVWCAPAEGSAPPERLTQGADHFLIRDVSHDGSRLILAQSRNACERDRLILLDRTAGNRLTDLTPPQETHYVYGGALSRDGASVFFVANHDYDRGETTKGGWLWRQEIATGARTCLHRCDRPFTRGVTLSPDGRRLLWPRTLKAPGGVQLWVLNAAGSEAREVIAFADTAPVTGDWLDDDRIAFVADCGAGDRAGILSLATGAIDWIGGEPGLCPHAVVTNGAGALALIVHDQSRSKALVGDGARLAPLVNRSGRRSLLPLAGLPDGGWLAEAYDADAPHDLVRINPDGTCQTLAKAAADPRRTYARPRDFRWTAPDGEAVQGWLYLPKGHPKGLIAYIHGGPTWHSEDWVNPKVGFWVQSGFAVLDPNYRGSTGFGRRWREMVKEDGWGGREQLDIRAGIEAALAAGIPGPVAVAGNSYGGFSSWWQIARSPDLVTAAIPMCGMWKLDIDYAATGMPWGQSYSEEMMGGSPAEVPEKYANASPGSFVDQIRGQVMVVHGLADTNVGPENTHAAVRDLTAAGVRHRVMLFEDEGHGIFRRGNVEAYLDASLAFLSEAFAEGPSL
jgi:dipeptidyl aminopeptidase/acylaminoacyl peptidase